MFGCHDRFSFLGGRKLRWKWSYGGHAGNPFFSSRGPGEIWCGGIEKVREGTHNTTTLKNQSRLSYQRVNISETEITYPDELSLWSGRFVLFKTGMCLCITIRAPGMRGAYMPAGKGTSYLPTPARGLPYSSGEVCNKVSGLGSGLGKHTPSVPSTGQMLKRGLVHIPHDSRGLDTDSNRCAWESRREKKRRECRVSLFTLRIQPTSNLLPTYIQHTAYIQPTGEKALQIESPWLGSFPTRTVTSHFT